MVIVTFQSASVLGACLLRIASIPDADIVVVDNASTDQSAEIARRAGAHVVAMDRNLGFARAANAGAQNATGDLLCFLNPDCYVTPEVCESARGVLGSGLKACAVPSFRTRGKVVSGRQAGYSRLKLIADVMSVAWWPSKIPRLLKRRPGYDDTGWHWPLGTCLFVTKDVFSDVGGFDEGYFMYMEDVEFGHVLKARGGEVVALPHVIEHDGGGSSKISKRRGRRLLRSARIRYGRRHYGGWFAVLLSLIAMV